MAIQYVTRDAGSIHFRRRDKGIQVSGRTVGTGSFGDVLGVRAS